MLAGTSEATNNGYMTTVVPITKATRCMAPNQKPTAEILPAQRRQNSTAAAMEPNVSSPSRTANTAAIERNQFTVDQTIETRMANGIKIRNANPAWGAFGVLTNEATIAE